MHNILEYLARQKEKLNFRWFILTICLEHSLLLRKIACAKLAHYLKNKEITRIAVE